MGDLFEQYAEEIIVHDNGDGITVRVPGERAVAELTFLPRDWKGRLPKGNWLWFNRLINQSGRAGLGGRLLDRLLGYCQEKGYSILNTVNAYGRIGQKDLERWYMKRGFKPFNKWEYGNSVLIWQPKRGENG